MARCRWPCILNERAQIGAHVRTAHGVGEQPTAASEAEGPNRVLHRVGVRRPRFATQEPHGLGQPLVYVVQRLARQDRRRNAKQVRVQQSFVLTHHRGAVARTQPQSACGRPALGPTTRHGTTCRSAARSGWWSDPVTVLDWLRTLVAALLSDCF